MKFRTKTIIGIASIEIILLVILVISAMSFMSETAETQLIQRANSTAKIFAQATEKDILSQDISSLDEIIQEVTALEDVMYIQVIRHGKELISGGDPQFIHRDIVIDKSLSTVDDGVFDVRVDLTTNGIRYGYIYIGFCNKSINAIINNARHSIVGIAIIEVLLVALFSCLIGHYLTKSLTKLTQAARKLSQEGPGYQVNIGSSDELGEVAEAFDQMSVSLAKSYDDLKLAREQAEHASESKTMFLASMSHEIRTPLNGVLGLLSLIRETPLNTDQKQLIETASQSGSFLLSLINDILDYTRMESNTLSLDYSKFDLQDCLSQVVDSFRPAATQKNMVIEIHTSPNLPTFVTGDQYRVKQILHNLIGNAVKFTPSGSVQVHLSAEELENHRLLITGSVSDTGIGIAQEAIPDLFEEFTMVDNTYSRRHDGSGLGLAICQRLCDMMDGDISVNSQPGKGSIFTFHIQLEQADNQHREIPSHPTSHQTDWQHAKILVAEDNKANQLVIKNMFLHVGIDIELAQSGLEAVEKVQQGNFDLVFMDISMPQMDGMQACQQIRAFKDTPKADLPIIALTAHALHGDKERFIAAGLTDYLSKPVRLAQLLEKLDLYLPKRLNAITSQQKIDGHPSPVLPEQTTLSEQATLSEQTVLPEQTALARQPASQSQCVSLVDEVIIQQVLADTSDDVLPMLIDHYIEECKQRMMKIECAIEAQKTECLKFEVHTLSSSAMALGNRPLSELARHIETLCTQGNIEEAYSNGQKLLQLATDSINALQHRKTFGFQLGMNPMVS